MERQSNECSAVKNRQNLKKENILKENGSNLPELMKNKNPGFQEAREEGKQPGRKRRSPAKE